MSDTTKFSIQDGVTLYDNDFSPCARRVKIVLIEKGIPFNKIPVDLTTGETKSPEYLKINPNGKVPALSVENVQGVRDCVLYESNVITEFLDSSFPGPKLYPEDKWAKAQARMWQDWELSLVDDFVPFVYQNVKPFMDRIACKTRDKYRASMHPNIPEARIDMLMKAYDGTYRSKEELETHGIACYKYLCQLEKSLEGKPYLVGDALSIADISVFPRVEMFNMIGLPIKHAKFPNVCKYLDNLRPKNCFMKSEPGGIGGKLAMFFIGYFPSLISTISNFRCGTKHERIDGSTFVDRAIEEFKEHEKTLKENDTKQEGIHLFYYPESAECWQMKLLLEEKGIAYSKETCNIVDLIGRPFGSMGTYRIYHGGHTVTGQRAILEYIDGTIENNKLMPNDPLKRAKVECWQAWEQTMYWIDMLELVETFLFSNIIYSRFKDSQEELLALETNPKYKEKFSNIMKCFFRGLQQSGDTKNNESAILKRFSGFIITEEEKHKIVKNYTASLHKRLEYLENSLKESKYLVGDDITLADICVFSRLLYFDYLNIEILETVYPCVYRWRTDLSMPQTFQKCKSEVNDIFKKYPETAT